MASLLINTPSQQAPGTRQDWFTWPACVSLVRFLIQTCNAFPWSSRVQITTCVELRTNMQNAHARTHAHTHPPTHTHTHPRPPARPPAQPPARPPTHARTHARNARTARTARSATRHTPRAITNLILDHCGRGMWPCSLELQLNVAS